MRAQGEEAFRAFVRQEWRHLVHTAYLLTGDRNHAEDLAQTALEKIHRQWGTLENPGAYTRRVMVNTAISWRRRRSYGEIPHEPQDTASPGDDFDQIDQRHQLVKALRRLPPKMRAVLVLRYFEDLPDLEIAQTLGCSTGTVKSQASRGIQRLREQFEITDPGLAAAFQRS
ncbi:SigE family RNA polymerase sigma factor [Kineosporia rhizophila]|uniref:SigE family RNA polymerase sigma factor n=1 Tax=Kineosporia TaxID=49184 RepID=UPI000AE7E9AE|nr:MULTISPECIES: SigE family RNA polymerase sigma factor [Kineosporia]MCE0538087.1 SigE family RNA polymerase sigma factor [Kineosporia rhizophila]GLY14915.1 DNA-directed RNA polymerase sigma-70 factor [Kineosporia sp. NBRC 101677]